MAITKGWDFGADKGFSGSAKGDTVKVSGHQRAKPGYADGGKVQKHFDRMGSYKKDVEAMPAKKAAGGSVGALDKNIYPPEKISSTAGTKDGVGAFAKGGSVTPKKAVHKHEKHLHKGQPMTKMAKGGKAKRGGGGGSTAKKAAGALAQIAKTVASAPGAAMQSAGAPGGALGQATAGLPMLPGMKRGGKAKK